MFYEDGTKDNQTIVKKLIVNGDKGDWIFNINPFISDCSKSRYLYTKIFTIHKKSAPLKNGTNSNYLII